MGALLKHFSASYNTSNFLVLIYWRCVCYSFINSIFFKSTFRDTIAVLVGSESLADEYVEESGDVYMARGHLAPKADFMYTSWQVIWSHSKTM